MNVFVADYITRWRCNERVWHISGLTGSLPPKQVTLKGSRYMSEEQAKYGHTFDGSDQVKSYIKKLDGYLTIDLPVIDRHLDITYALVSANYVKHLQTVENLENERRELDDKALWSLVPSPEAYNQSISGVIQKAEKLIAKLENLQRSGLK